MTFGLLSSWSFNYYCPPKAVNDSVSCNTNQSLSIACSTLLANDSYATGINSLGSCANGVLTLLNGCINFVPHKGFTGDTSFTYTCHDGKGGYSTATCYVKVCNTAPDAVNDVINNTAQGAVTITAATLLANDTDKNGDKLTITSVQAANNGTVTLQNGNVVFTPTAGYTGPASFTYTISDGKGGADTATASFNVKPVVNMVDALDDNLGTVAANTPVVTSAATLIGNDKDPEGDAFTLTSVSNPVNGTVSLVNGVVTFTPTVGFSGDASYNYTITDAKGATDTATVSFKVAAPINTTDALDDNLGTVPANAPVVTTAATLLANDKDAQGDAFTLTSVGSPVNGSVSLVNGVVTFTPTAGFTGAASYKYTITDAKGATDTATVTLNVTAPANNAPDAIDDPDSINSYPYGQGPAAGTTIGILPSQLLSNDTDPDGDPLTFVSVQDPVNGTVAFLAGQIKFTPTPGYTGPASFTYTITDGKGGFDTATVKLFFYPPATTPPTAGDDNVGNVPANTITVIDSGTLLANDSDPDGPDALVIADVHNVSGGTVTLDQATGKITFTPTAGYTGPASFTYDVYDGAGGYDTATVTLNVTAPVVNTTEAVNDDLGTKPNGSPVVTTVAALLANDKDAQGDAFTLTSVGNPTNGTVKLVGGVVTFTPTAGYTGPATYTYTITDAQGATDTATVTLNIAAPVNHVPDAVNDSYSTKSGVPLTITNLLANDTDTDGDKLTITSVQNAQNGTVSLVNGQVVFTPEAGYSGPASFSYSISDGKGGTDNATANITITKNLVHGTSYNDTLNGTSAADEINGKDGCDTLYGNDGNDLLNGGNHNDTLNGGNGNDTLIGGAGNDCLIGGVGADVFAWSLADTLAKGVECDTVKDFSIAQGDKLDLRDLLIGENATAASLDNYLHFETYNGTTTIYVDTAGKFLDGNKANCNTYDISCKADQTITLCNVNLTSGYSTDAQIIANLLAKNLIITD